MILIPYGLYNIRKEKHYNIRNNNNSSRKKMEYNICSRHTCGGYGIFSTSRRYVSPINNIFVVFEETARRCFSEFFNITITTTARRFFSALVCIFFSFSSFINSDEYWFFLALHFVNYFYVGARCIQIY